MSEEKKIKFVKRANQWVCSWWKSIGRKDKQEQKWFSTKEEAEAFASSNKEDNSN